MSRLRLLVAVMAVVATMSISPWAAADCAAPDVSTSTRSASPGEEIVVVGQHWADACNDTQGPGCNPPPLGDPIQDIHLQLMNMRSGRSFPLVTVNATSDHDFEATIEIPEVPRGRYEIVDADGTGYFIGKPLMISRSD